jgi:hypothetical protein
VNFFPLFDLTEMLLGGPIYRVRRVLSKSAIRWSGFDVIQIDGLAFYEVKIIGHYDINPLVEQLQSNLVVFWEKCKDLGNDLLAAQQLARIFATKLQKFGFDTLQSLLQQGCEVFKILSPHDLQLFF